MCCLCTYNTRDIISGVTTPEKKNALSSTLRVVTQPKFMKFIVKGCPYGNESLAPNSACKCEKSRKCIIKCRVCTAFFRNSKLLILLHCITMSELKSPD